MLSRVTRYSAVTHIESDIWAPKCCGHPDFCNTVRCLWNIHPSKQSSLSVLWGTTEQSCVCICGPVWWRFPLSLCYLGATWLLHNSHPSLCVSSPWLCYTMSSCGAKRCGVVWLETSAPLLLRNPLFTWFCLCVAFFISRQCEKRAQEHTNSIQMTTEEIQLQETHSPPTRPWAHSGFHCMQTRMRGWAYSMLCYHKLQQSLSVYMGSSFPLFVLGQTCHIHVCKLAGILVVYRKRKHRHLLISSGEVEAKSCVRQQGLLSWQSFQFVIWAGPRHALEDLGL